MNIQKRCLSILLVMAMLCSLIVVPATAGDTAAPHLSASTDVTEVKVGDEITVVLRTSQMDIISYTGGIAYDPAFVTLEKYTPKSYLLTGKMDGEDEDSNLLLTISNNTVDETTTEGVVGIYAVGVYDATYNAAETLTTITFKATAAGTAKFYLYENCDGTESVDNQHYGEFTVEVKDEAAGESYLTVIGADGEEVRISDSEIKAAASVTATTEEPWTYGSNTCVGTFYSFKSILETAGIDVSEAHGLKVTATDGFISGFSAEEIDNLYIYDQGTVTKNGTVVGEAGTYGTAINGSAGNKWARNIASVTVAADHVMFVKNGACKHYCAICGADEASLTVVDAEGTETAIHACEIKAAASDTATAEEPWGYNGTYNYVGTFYSFKSILETAGIDVSEAHGLKVTATDGFISGFSAEEIDDLYIYDQGTVTKDGTVVGEAGTYGTAINGSAGNKWARNIASVTVAADHVMFVKNGACKHYCAICGADEASLTVVDADGTETAIHDCEIKAAASVTATAEEPWTYGSNTCVGTFYSFKSILETAGIDISEAHGLKVTATDGFISGFSAEEIDNLYIYDQGTVTKNGTVVGEAGTYGTAINGSAGNKWARNIASITVAADHVMFVKNGACMHYCAICGADEETVVDAAVAPTCTEDGKTEGSHYGECGTVIVAQESVQATGHTWGDGVVTTQPTVDSAGVMTYTCTVCGATREERIDPLTPAEVPFTDIKEGEYYYNAVLWAVENNITSGTSPTTFSPEDACTRAQVVAFLWRTAGTPEPTTTSNPFTDVKADDYYYKAVLWAVENGIVYGTSSTTFSPNQSCTRAQVAAFLWRAAGTPEPTTTNNPFHDVDASEYYGKAVIWAAENQIVYGTSTTRFSPDESCTRAQIVSFLYRTYGK